MYQRKQDPTLFDEIIDTLLDAPVVVRWVSKEPERSSLVYGGLVKLGIAYDGPISVSRAIESLSSLESIGGPETKALVTLLKKFDEEGLQEILCENLDLVKYLAENAITKSDVVAFGYRKTQLEIFDRLLNDDAFFTDKQAEWGKRTRERSWQHFFEMNHWIFGYGLTYVFTSPLDDKKLEQVTSGHQFNKAGKRTDGLLKTKGVISSLCFVEIKHDRTDLLDNKSYREECWPISAELAGAVAQIQKTVQKAIEGLDPKEELFDKDGTPTGEVVHLYRPRSFIIAGSLREFQRKHGVNQQQFSSFELFRRELKHTEILTFDELLEVR